MTSDTCKHLKWAFCVVVLFLILYVGAIVFSVCMVSHNNVHWIELLNGATLPHQFVEGDPSRGIQPIRTDWFYMTLGFRTILNFGIVLSAVFWVLAIYFLSTGKVERFLMSRLVSVLNVRDMAMAGYIAKNLRDQKISLSPSQQESLRQAFREFRNSAAGKVFSDNLSSLGEEQEAT